ncbi:hypothetical protein [Bartonella sp. B17]
MSNQVPQKRLDSKRIGYETISLRTLKALTHYMREAYNDFVGCSYAIQYPLWGRRDDGLTTVFLSTRHSSGVSIKNV